MPSFKKTVFKLLVFISISNSISGQIPLTLLNDFNTEPSKDGTSPREISSFKNNIYFAADGLWKTDGTLAGTSRVNDIINFDGPYNPIHLLPTDEYLFFSAMSKAGNYRSIWRTDGTQEGTLICKTFSYPILNYINRADAVRTKGFFIVKHSHQTLELWQSDGSPEGTLLVKEMYNNFFIDEAVETPLREAIHYNEDLYFNVMDSAGNGSLWKTNGTTDGTFMVIAGTIAREFFVHGNTLFFDGLTSGTTSKLWKTDGTTAGTSVVTSALGGPEYPTNFTSVGSELYFTTFGNLWKSDGTPGGTIKVKGGFVSFGKFCADGNKVFFTADDASHGMELWNSDGTASGTSIAYETAFSSGFFEIKELASINGQVFLIYNNKLFRLNGSATVQIDGDGLQSPKYLTAINNVLYCSGWQYQSPAFTKYPELWKSDGTDIGTVMISDPTGTASSLPGNFTTSNGSLYFNTLAGYEFGKLYKTDGTLPGTVLISDKCINSIAIRNSNTILFVSTDPTNGQELWKTDGTPGGETLVKDINPGTASSAILQLVQVGDEVFFTAYDVVHGRELWKTDGTEPGTVLVADLNSGIGNTSIANYIEYGNELFFTMSHVTYGTELWITDGTEAGTHLVKDIEPGNSSGSPTFFITAGNFLYFTAYQTAFGYELWKTNGTEVGTTMVKDIDPGIRSGALWSLFGCDDIIYFVGSTISTGYELWRSDGSESGTYLVKDIYPGD